MLDAHSAPSTARPHSAGRPIATRSAPSAIPLRTSMPRRTPPSTTSSVAVADRTRRSRAARRMRRSPCRAAGRRGCSPRCRRSPPRRHAPRRRPAARPWRPAGSEQTERSQASSSQSMVGSTMMPDSSTGWSGGRCTPRSSSKPLRTSRSRLPGIGRSTVTTTAEKPAAVARSTSCAAGARGPSVRRAGTSGARPGAACGDVLHRRPMRPSTA